MKNKKWDIQFGYNYTEHLKAWWFSLGIHIDHTQPYVVIHLPIIIICIGNCIQPGFSHSLYRWITGNPY